VEELGIEPNPGLKQVERAILDQDASLELPLGAAPRRPPGGAGEERPPSAARSRRARLLTAAVASLAVTVALLAGGAAVRGHGPAAPVGVSRNTAAVTNASGNVVPGELPGIGRRGGIAHGAGPPWFTDTADDLLLRVDSAGRVIDRIPVGRGPAGV